jgi:hypothetical protein
MKRASTYFFATVILAGCMSAGCATESRAPFHMYNSPLLEGEAQSRFPKSRAFDPSEVGDHPTPDTMYASNGEAAGGGPPSATDGASAAQPATAASSDTDDKGSTPPPTLSTTRDSTKSKSTGTSESPSRDDNDRAAGGADLRQKPALSARFTWEMYRLNEVTFSEQARSQVTQLFRECKERGEISHSSKPAVGDLVFFHNTGDFNDDGRNNDWYTHVALVESRDGATVSLLGYRGGEVQRFAMNLESPNAKHDRHGHVTNSQMRPRRDDDPPFTQYLAGQLFAGTCSVLGDRDQLVVVDNWQPGMDLDR